MILVRLSIMSGCTLLCCTMLTSCRPDEPAEAVPASDYIRPDEPPVYVSPRGDIDHGLSFTDITASAGVDFRHVTGAAGDKWMPETMGGGVAFLDYDGDGYPDLLFINSTFWPGHTGGPSPPSARLYRNRGDGTFEDVTEAAGLAQLSVYGMGVAVADYNAGGYPDIYITAVGKNYLFRNNGDGTFSDVTDETGVGFSTCCGQASPWEWSTGAVWVDYDRDGRLDLFVANYVQWTPETDIWTTLDGTHKSYATPHRYQGATCVLFRNKGDGTFSDVTKKAGVYQPEGKSLGVVLDDFNDDGWPDIVVTNDTQPNCLYINNQDGTFTDRALSLGVAYDANGLARAGMGVDSSDLNNAGIRSIAIGNFSGEPVSLYTQAGDATFIDRAGATRLSRPTLHPLTFGLLFADVNLDGFDDLLLANGHIEPEIEHIRKEWSFAQPPQLFLNNREGQFVEIGPSLGPPLNTPMVGRGLAVADIDNDGDLDAVITSNGGPPRLLWNDLKGANAVRVRLIGAGANRDAIGARLVAWVESRRISRFITTGGSYLSQSELTATFGLGDATALDELTVRWPDGTEADYGSLAAGATYTIQQAVGVIDEAPFRR